MDEAARHSSRPGSSACLLCLDSSSRSFFFAPPSLCTFLSAPSRFELLSKDYAACYEPEGTALKGQQRASAGKKKVDDLCIKVVTNGLATFLIRTVDWYCVS